MTKSAAMTWLHFAYLNDPKQWRLRAAEARIQVEKITDPEAKRIMLEIADGYIADGYEELARRAEKGLVWDEREAT